MCSYEYKDLEYFDHSSDKLDTLVVRNGIKHWYSKLPDGEIMLCVLMSDNDNTHFNAGHSDVPYSEFMVYVSSKNCKDWEKIKEKLVEADKTYRCIDLQKETQYDKVMCSQTGGKFPCIFYRRPGSVYKLLGGLKELEDYLKEHKDIDNKN